MRVSDIRVESRHEAAARGVTRDSLSRSDSFDRSRKNAIARALAIPRRDADGNALIKVRLTMLVKEVDARAIKKRIKRDFVS